jgi:rsbT co-antagonist protein RsbR
MNAPEDSSLPAQPVELLQSVIDSFDDPVFVKDRTHRWTACNQAFCRLLGATREGIIGCTDADYFPPEQVEVFLRIDSEVINAGVPVINEESLTSADGVCRTIYTRKYPLRNKQGAIIGLAGIITDITEIKQRQEEIQQLEAALEDKAATIESQRILLEQVAVPVIQVWDGVLLLPLIGVIDSHRAARILESTLEAIAHQQARVLVLDITGVPLVDTSVASHLIQTVRAARLLGCECLLVGISPHVAQTLVQLGIDFGSIQTQATLQQGLAYALERLNYTVQHNSTG